MFVEDTTVKIKLKRKHKMTVMASRTHSRLGQYTAKPRSILLITKNPNQLAKLFEEGAACEEGAAHCPEQCWSPPSPMAYDHQTKLVDAFA